MYRRIPENILEDILSRVDIVEVISGHLPLKRAGRNFKANCPFHHEKTPSFMVSPDRQIYHCFGCGESGNAFKFLMSYEHLDFPEAVEALAKRAGVSLPEQRDTDAQATSLFTQLYKINELAQLFYEQNLNSPIGTGAKNYLLKRGINQDALHLFKLGFAPDRWDSLINQLRAKNISLALLEKAGLVLAKEGGGYYDRFRNRIVFPIFDIKSKIIGFGARVLDNGLPKYINSPETPVYTKSKNLYGLNFAKDAIRQNDCAVVVEGYLDFIVPYQAGVQNIVASLGTALTQEQVRLLKRYSHNVVIVYDGDAAGQMATLRTLDIFIEEGVHVKVVSLPEGIDPDTFVRTHGADRFKGIINRAENIFDYKMNLLKSRNNCKEIEGKVAIVSEMLITVNKFNNAVLKSEYIKRLSEELDVKESDLLEELRKIKNDVPRPQINKTKEKKEIKINPTEKLLIQLMLEEASLVEYIRQRFEPADFQDEITSKIVSTMFELSGQGKTIDLRAIMNCHENEDISQIICESAFMPEIPSQDKEKIADECIERLKHEKMKLKRQYLHDQIKLAQHTGDEEKVNSLMQEFHLLIKKG
jgi:DNA primase